MQHHLDIIALVCGVILAAWLGYRLTVSVRRHLQADDFADARTETFRDAAYLAELAAAKRETAGSFPGRRPERQTPARRTAIREKVGPALELPDPDPEPGWDILLGGDGWRWIGNQPFPPQQLLERLPSGDWLRTLLTGAAA